mmetsp:Transcript_19077/g.38557  ORF Transcript_19077/g.38557 Transcript_19077/m.38557 type:complete len:344 (+) Transcript_19077:86-1117(+)
MPAVATPMAAGAPEASLVVKRTFLEYKVAERLNKPSGVELSDTELLESVGLISVSPSATTVKTMCDVDLNSATVDAPLVAKPSPAFAPTTPAQDCIWPETPMLDAVFEPFSIGAASADEKALMGQFWLPSAAALDENAGQMMYDAPWMYMDFSQCCWDATWAETGLWPPSPPSTASGSGDVESESFSSETEAHAAGAERSTVMLRNLPKAMGRELLLQKLDRMGFAGQYDFVYVPVDFSSGTGLGYAFINMSVPGAAAKLWEELDGMSTWDFDSDAVCTVSWSDPHQGLAAHIERYRNSPVMHPNVPDEWKPAVFMHGMRVTFPPPTQKLKAPKVRSKKGDGA